MTPKYEVPKKISERIIIYSPFACPCHWPKQIRPTIKYSYLSSVYTRR
jgi:hypothetical protein